MQENQEFLSFLEALKNQSNEKLIESVTNEFMTLHEYTIVNSGVPKNDLMEVQDDVVDSSEELLSNIHKCIMILQTMQAAIEINEVNDQMITNVNSIYDCIRDESNEFFDNIYDFDDDDDDLDLHPNRSRVVDDDDDNYQEED